MASTIATTTPATIPSTTRTTMKPSTNPRTTMKPSTTTTTESPTTKEPLTQRPKIIKTTPGNKIISIYISYGKLLRQENFHNVKVQLKRQIKKKLEDNSKRIVHNQMVNSKAQIHQTNG